MTLFQTAGHLVRWAGLTPVARQSGPRSRKPGKRQGDSYLRGYCTQAATGAATLRCHASRDEPGTARVRSCRASSDFV
jgi:hypothetical protein